MQSVTSCFGDISRSDVDAMASHAVAYTQFWRLPPCVHFDCMPTAEKVSQCEEIIRHVQDHKNAWLVWRHSGYNVDKQVNMFHVGNICSSDLPSSHKKGDHLRKLFFPRVTWVTDPAVVDKRHIPRTGGAMCPKYLPLLFTDFMRLNDGDNVFMNSVRIHVTFHPKTGRTRVDKLKRVLISGL